jgi:hypothetical protein
MNATDIRQSLDQVQPSRMDDGRRKRNLPHY